MAYRWVDHTAELELTIAAPTEAAVFEEALQAFGELVGDEPAGETVAFDLELTAADRATLLVSWLDELVYRAETEDLVPEAVEHLELNGDRLVATVRGTRSRPRHLVKGVTYSGLTFERADDGYRATVVLDV
jgi:SHS2 domain-containing protein